MMKQNFAPAVKSNFQRDFRNLIQEDTKTHS